MGFRSFLKSHIRSNAFGDVANAHCEIKTSFISLAQSQHSLALRMTFERYKKESRSKERLSVNLLSYNKLLRKCASDIHCDSATLLRILIFLEHQPLWFVAFGE
ncbi:MAG: hypothetical protein J6V20_02570 [Bacteroidaceae bacterium]|nr:hypothetical protein [Bacteroidaceae bacterium]